jgi:hypothetical protein
MTKTLEETFNLPPIPDDDDVNTEETALVSIDAMQDMLDKADKIDSALPAMSSNDLLDRDFDDYAAKSIEVFDDLIELSKNIEDKNVPPIMAAANQMMSNAISAKNSKLDRKLKLIKLQIEKAKVDLERDRLAFQKFKETPLDTIPNNTPAEGKIIGSRADLIKDILAADLIKDILAATKSSDNGK